MIVDFILLHENIQQIGIDGQDVNGSFIFDQKYRTKKLNVFAQLLSLKRHYGLIDFPYH